MFKNSTNENFLGYRLPSPVTFYCGTIHKKLIGPNRHLHLVNRYQFVELQIDWYRASFSEIQDRLSPLPSVLHACYYARQ